MRNISFPKIITAGLLVGTLDISAALIRYYAKTGKNPMTVPKYIASAVFGEEAFAGGNSMIIWGFLFHYLIAVSFTIFFFFLYRNLRLLSYNPVLTGIVYGLFIWAVMDMLIVPLSAAPVIPFSLSGAVIAALILIICIGMPLALLARHWSKE